MPSKPYVLGGRYFNSQGSVLDYVRELWKLQRGTRLEGEQELVVRDLLLMHPKEPEKTEGILDYIYVDKAPEHNTTCFHIMLTDGRHDDFSVGKCIEKGDRRRADFKAACRSAVEDQVTQAYEEYVATEQGKTHKDSGVGIHVDHKSPTFDCMVGKFYLGKRLKLSEVEFKKPERSVSRIQFADPQLSSDFAAYHYKHAVLECVTTRENLSKRKAGVRKVWIDEEMAVYVKPEDWELNLPL